MYGKHFESMYEGSMYGSGLHVFAVWGYVIAHTKGSRVELNPRKLSDTLGGSIEEISAAIEFLKKPDPISRHREHEGRRLIQEGQFQYFVPSWEHYHAIRTAEERREYNRIAQQNHRKKINVRTGPINGEVAAVKSYENGTVDKDFQPIKPRRVATKKRVAPAADQAAAGPGSDHPEGPGDGAQERLAEVDIPEALK